MTEGYATYPNPTVAVTQVHGLDNVALGFMLVMVVVLLVVVVLSQAHLASWELSL